MNGMQAAFWTFIASALAYGYLSMRQSAKVKSIYDFFHDADLRKNELSYTAANVTLGTGLIYILSSVGSLGALFVLVPVMMLAGYLSLARFYDRLVPEELVKDDLIKGLSLSIDKSLGKNYYFGFAFTAIIMTTFALLLAFEIFASSKIFANLMFTEPTTRHEVFAGSAVFLVALLYTLWGGYKAVQVTDLAQLVLVAFLLLTLGVVFGLGPRIEGESGPGPWLPPLSLHLIMGAIAAALAAFTTQYYSLMNLCAATHQDKQGRPRLFIRIGQYTFVLLMTLVVGALVVSVTKGVPYAALLAAVETHTAGGGMLDICFAFTLMAGMAAVIFSTVDTLLVSLTQFAYSNLWGRSTNDKAEAPEALRLVRLNMAVLGPILFLLLTAIWVRQPDIFGLLLAITTGNDVLLPLLVLLVLLHKRNRLEALSGPFGFPLFWLFFLLYIISAVLAIALVLLHSPYVRYIGPVFFLVASVAALVILRRKGVTVS